VNGDAPADRPVLPPLVLRCRPFWRIAFGFAAIFLLILGVSTIAGGGPGDPGAVEIAAGAVLLLFGAGCVHFFLRHCLSSISLDEHGFRVEGPLLDPRRIAWAEVISWGHVSVAGPGALRVIYGETRARLTLPRIYEDVQALEVGLAQRRFPVY
jgi:hypothetical protein